MTKDDYEILLNMMASREKPPEFAVKLLEDTCKKTGLDWKLRHVYLMARGGKWMVTLSIDGFRLIGSQDPDYAGQDGPLWVSGAEGTWSDVPPDGRIYAAKVGIKHKGGNTTWGVAKFSDYKSGAMWDKFPSTMSAKCAEMLAWRKAFPGRLGGLYGLEEMAQANKAAAEIIERGETKEPILQDVTPAEALTIKTGYSFELEKATNYETLSEIGKRIASDKRMEEGAIADLHMAYLKKKVELAKRANI